MVEAMARTCSSICWDLNSMGEVVNITGGTFDDFITPSAQSRGLEMTGSRFGGGGEGPMEPQISIRDYVDARDEAIESRLDSKLEKLATKGTIWGAVGTAIGIMLAVLAFGADRFDGGVSASAVIDRVRVEQAKTDQAQNAKLDSLNNKLDILLERSAHGDPSKISGKR